MVDLITEVGVAIDEVMGIMGRTTIEAVLTMSAEQVAGGPFELWGGASFWSQGMK